MWCSLAGVLRTVKDPALVPFAMCVSSCPAPFVGQGIFPSHCVGLGFSCMCGHLGPFCRVCSVVSEFCSLAVLLLNTRGWPHLESLCWAGPPLLRLPLRCLMFKLGSTLGVWGAAVLGPLVLITRWRDTASCDGKMPSGHQRSPALQITGAKANPPVDLRLRLFSVEICYWPCHQVWSPVFFSA